MLILAPTRELAMQIAGVLEAAGKPLGLSTLCAYGGVPKPPQASCMTRLLFLLTAAHPPPAFREPAQRCACPRMLCTARNFVGSRDVSCPSGAAHVARLGAGIMCATPTVQTKALRKGVNVLVATPGRLEDLMNDGAARLHHVT